MRTLIRALFLFLMLWPAATLAEPVRYVLDRDRSTAGFVVQTAEEQVTGSFPILDAEVVLDLDHNRNSLIRVRVDASNPQTDLPFARQALRSKEMLDTGRFPVMTFESRDLRIARTSAVLTGDMTIRGVTRPVRLDAQVFRQQGTDPGDLSRLAVHVTGVVRRSDFGVTGLPGLVQEEIQLNIVVRIDRAGG